MFLGSYMCTDLEKNILLKGKYAFKHKPIFSVISCITHRYLGSHEFITFEWNYFKLGMCILARLALLLNSMKHLFQAADSWGDAICRTCMLLLNELCSRADYLLQMQSWLFASDAKMSSACITCFWLQIFAGFQLFLAVLTAILNICWQYWMWCGSCGHLSLKKCTRHLASFTQAIKEPADNDSIWSLQPGRNCNQLSGRIHLFSNNLKREDGIFYPSLPKIWSS